MPGTTTPLTRRMRWFAVPLAALSVVGATACGTASTSDSGTPTTNAGGDRAEPAGMREFDSCMSEHGVTMPARGQGGPSEAARPPADGAGPGGAARGEQGSADGARAGGMKYDPATAPPGVDQTTWTNARAACASLAPTPPKAPQGSGQ